MAQQYDNMAGTNLPLNNHPDLKKTGSGKKDSKAEIAADKKKGISQTAAEAKTD